MVHKPFVIEDSLQGYQRLVAKLYQCQRQYHTQEFRIGLGATSDYWKNLYYFLKKQSEQFVLVVINPVRTKAFTKTELRRAKTDPVDAKDMALFMVEKNPAASKDRTPIFDAIKDIDTQIYTMRKQQTMSLNKLRIELGKVAPEIEKAVLNLNGKQILALLAAHPTAEVVAPASIEELRGVSYGQRQWPLLLDFVQKMKELAQNSVAHKTGPGAGVVVQCLVRRISQGQQEVEILKEQINKLYRQVNINQSILTTIIGAAMRKLLVYIYVILKNQTPFDPEKNDKSKQKT